MRHLFRLPVGRDWVFRVGLMLTGLLCCGVAGVQAAEVFLQHGDIGAGQWWHTRSVQLQEGKDNQWLVTGQGRTAFQNLETAVHVRLQEAAITVQDPKSVFFIDQYGQQFRIMVLRGRLSVVCDGRKYVLVPSLQLMGTPVSGTGKFIYDGIYRRPVLFQDKTPQHQLAIRQFYLEQLVHIDPLIKTIYHHNREGRRMVEQLNKSAANLRSINGVDGYVAQQM